MSAATKKLPSNEILTKLYCDLGLTAREIANAYSANHSTAKRALHRAGIPMRRAVRRLPGGAVPDGPWRVGKHIALNVYDGDRPVCQCHTARDAKRIVAAMNRAIRAEARRAYRA